MDAEELPQNSNTDTQKLLKYQQFYRILLSKYQVCCGCVYRIFGIMTPKLYSQPNNGRKIMEVVIKIAEEKCKEVGVRESYRFMLGEFKSYYEGLANGGQEFCWLCSGILQPAFLAATAKAVIDKVKEELFQHKQKYKLNVKIHNLFAIKFQVFCSLALAQLQILQIIDKLTLSKISNELIMPLFQKTGLDIKTVFKWKLSNIINHLPAQKFTLCSTINEDEQTVIVSIQIDHNSADLNSLLTNLLGPSMHLEKTKVKKGRIQLDQNNNYQANWTLGMITRISQINQQQWVQILGQNNIEVIRKLQLKSGQAIATKISLQSENIFFCGKYVKFSRFLSQTPWVVNKERLTQSSLQQQVQKKILRFFYPEAIPQNRIDIKFHAGGREDIDVRMLKGGRPFVLQFVNPRKCLADIPTSDILLKIKQEYPEQSKNLPFSQLCSNSTDLSVEEQELIKAKLLQFYVNVSTQLAKVNSFQKTTSSFISKQLKQAQIQKIKHYVCYIKCQEDLTEADKLKLESCHNLAVLQKTPVRVLHRRTLMYRDKIVHKMIFHKATRKSAVLEIWASAGTYIKQFVHGDLNRTLPNVGSIIGKQVDILQLDVGSLKEGEWVENDHQSMKLGQMAWENINIE